MDEEKGNAKNNTGFWKPQLHFVWDIIFDKLLQTEQNAGNGFENFFRVVVDGNPLLFSYLLKRGIFLIFLSFRHPFCCEFVNRAQVLGIPSVPQSATKAATFSSLVHIHT